MLTSISWRTTSPLDKSDVEALGPGAVATEVEGAGDAQRHRRPFFIRLGLKGSTRLCATSLSPTLLRPGGLALRHFHRLVRVYHAARDRQRRERHSLAAAARPLHLEIRELRDRCHQNPLHIGG